MEFKKSLLCLAAAATLSSGAAIADQPSYSYIDGGYARADIDDFGLKPSGIFLRGSTELGDNWFIQAGYESLDDDSGLIDVDADGYNLGIGFKTGLGDSSSFHITLDYVDAEVDVSHDYLGSGSADEDGYAIGLGVRGNVSENFELNARIDYVDFDIDDSTSYGIGALWNISDAFGIVLEYSADDDSNNEFRIGGRFSF